MDERKGLWGRWRRGGWKLGRGGMVGGEHTLGVGHWGGWGEGGSGVGVWRSTELWISCGCRK